MTETKSRAGLKGLTRGKRIEHYRELRGMSRLDLAVAAQCNPSYIWKVENDKVNRPAHDALMAIAKALRMPRGLVD